MVMSFDTQGHCVGVSFVAAYAPPDVSIDGTKRTILGETLRAVRPDPVFSGVF